MVLTCVPDHQLAQQRAIKVQQLNGERYVAFDRELRIRREVDRFLHGHGVSVDVVLEFDNIENIKKAVEIAAGVALLPLPTLFREINAGTLAAVPLEDSRFVRPLGIIRQRHHKLGPMAQQFLDCLRAAGTRKHAT